MVNLLGQAAAAGYFLIKQSGRCLQNFYHGTLTFLCCARKCLAINFKKTSQDINEDMQICRL